MNKKLVLFLLVGVLAFSLLLTTTTHAVSERISYLMEKNIVVGDETGDLKLDESISRAALAKIVVYTIGQEVKAESLKNAPSIFKDMKVGSWANGFANVAATEGIIAGYPNGNFGPNDPVTYEQAIKMLVVATMGNDLEESEKKGKPWSTPYIEKASDLGLLKHSNISNYKLVAPREQIFDILYEAIRYRENQNSSGIRGLILGKSNDKFKLKVFRTEKEEPYKENDTVLVNFQNPMDAENAIGKVVDFKLTNDQATNLKIAKEYEIKQGKAKIGNDGLLYFEGEKRGYEIDLNDYKKDYLQGIIHNGVEYSYKPYMDEVNKKLDYAVVTLHNSKVVFIRSFNFIDIAPVTRNDMGNLYILKDSRPKGETKVEIMSAWKLEDDGLKTVDPMRIEIDDILHFYNKNAAIITSKTLSNVKFKVESSSKGTYLQVGTHLYEISDENEFRAIGNIDFKEYITIFPKRNLGTIKAMEGKSSVILLDLFDRVQLVRGDLKQQEEMMIVDGTAGNKVRLLDMLGQTHEVMDNYDLEIFDGKRMARMTDLVQGNLVYVFRDGEEFKKISLLETKDEMLKKALPVDKNGEYKIDLLPTRGRHALVYLDGKAYELTASTEILVEDGNSLRPTTLKQIKNHANIKGMLKAYPLTVKDFEAMKTGSNIVSGREDLLTALVFFGYEEYLAKDQDRVVRMVYGFNPDIDKTMTVDYSDAKQEELRIFKNAKLDNFSVGDIVKISLSKDSQVISAEKLLTSENRTYIVLGIVEKDGVTKLELKRADAGDMITKYLARDVEIFGDLKIGSIVQMHVIKDDIKVLNVLR